ncbi:flagellar biosynthetic protein FliO [Cupriavidus taiwanensis]|uniref:Flagellar protein n=1 Tax=Cupriavidus taiwanensis (strain DSM 17343 / BCRC 17206 / CCUG 44338 / CIP 107171 / LMG 19424 / R1) TaxID=977880 RepID=B2AIF9_CUPTR|nr:flagellar biosynthetic protein FliO [Cupriavidus taiwanensis]CAP63558.1 FliO: Flagellar biosynthesis protein. fliO/mopB family [Cupriavidus taiwanensis LMG 19424]SPC18212.1 FliO: Flagellar biosynthesis protein. fliO/mopB family [Cupriavidus taiwanensis]
MTAATRARLAALAALPGAAMAADGSQAPAIGGAASLAQAGLGLFAIIALILGLAWMARRAGLVRHATGGAMKVVGSTMLGARQRLVLVEVGDTWLVLGVSPGEIRPLHTMAAGTPSASQTGAHLAAGPSQPPTGGTFAEKLLRSMQSHFKS